MKKKTLLLVITAILLAPFAIITAYWGIEKYIYFMFDIKDYEITTLITVMLTLLLAIGVGVTVVIFNEKKSL